MVTIRTKLYHATLKVCNIFTFLMSNVLLFFYFKQNSCAYSAADRLPKFVFWSYFAEKNPPKLIKYISLTKNLRSSFRVIRKFFSSWQIIYYLSKTKKPQQSTKKELITHSSKKKTGFGATTQEILHICCLMKFNKSAWKFPPLFCWNWNNSSFVSLVALR